MNKTELLSILENPTSISENEINSLEKLKLEFPYCHSLHLLFQKGLKNTKSLDFDKHLGLTSLNSPNREILYNLIFKIKLRERIIQIEEEISKEIDEETLAEAIKSENYNIELPVQKGVTEKIIDEVEELILEVVSQKDYFEDDESVNNERFLEPEQNLPKNIEESQVELETEKSFLSWLNPKSKGKENINNKQTSKTDLIDRFIKDNPSISKAKKEQYNISEIAQLSLNDNDDLVTETLARVYMKQGHYDKAIKTYQKLCLKIPEKKSFFASQIEVIEELKKQK